MGRKSLIEWCDASWNPWYGCDRVSSGCLNCYAESKWARRAGVEFFGNVQRSKSMFAAPLKWETPKLIFTCSLGDFFHPAADPWRDEAWSVIRETPHHTYQILTKRPQRITENLPWPPSEEPWHNVWIGTSVEAQKYVYRIPELLEVRAVVRFVSAEPLLGPLDLSIHMLMEPPLHWVIIGGESGPRARPMRLDWARDLVQQCKRARVPVFVKQLSQHECKQYDDFHAFPPELQVREYPR